MSTKSRRQTFFLAAKSTHKRRQYDDEGEIARRHNEQACHAATSGACCLRRPIIGHTFEPFWRQPNESFGRHCVFVCDIENVCPSLLGLHLAPHFARLFAAKAKVGRLMRRIDMHRWTAGQACVSFALPLDRPFRLHAGERAAKKSPHSFLAASNALAQPLRLATASVATCCM